MAALLTMFAVMVGALSPIGQVRTGAQDPSPTYDQLVRCSGIYNLLRYDAMMANDEGQTYAYENASRAVIAIAAAKYGKKEREVISDVDAAANANTSKLPQAAWRDQGVICNKLTGQKT